MNDYQNNLAIFIILILSITLVILTLIRKFDRYEIRKIPSLENLRKYIGLSIEQGKKVHFSLGKSKITQVSGQSSLISLASLENVYHLSSMSDRPPMVTSGSGDLSILSKDIIQSSYRKINALDQYEPDYGYLTGPTNFSYLAGAMPESLNDDTSALILIGNFGSEIVLLTDAARRKNAMCFGATDSLLGQAAIYASTDDSVIGEDLFAIPENLSKKPVDKASLHVQDLLRWATIATLIFGSMLKLFGVL
jgi:hypothetical protein